MALFYFVYNTTSNVKEIGWSTFEPILAQHDLEKIVVVNKEVIELYIKQDRLEDPKYKELLDGMFNSRTGPHYQMTIGTVETFEDKLLRAQQDFPPEEKIDVQYQNRTSWINMFSWLLPFGLIILFWFFILRRTRGGRTMGSSLFNFGKSTAKLTEKGTKSSVTFADIAGLKEAKIEVMEVVDFLKNPDT